MTSVGVVKRVSAKEEKKKLFGKKEFLFGFVRFLFGFYFCFVFLNENTIALLGKTRRSLNK